MFLQLGFRNLLRNKKRSLLAGMAVGLGLAAIIIADGFWKGMIENMISNITSTYIGHVQIHHPKYQEGLDSKFQLTNYHQIQQDLNSNNDIRAYTYRVLSLGMLSSTQDSRNAQVIGVHPEHEKKISKFHQRILRGRFIHSESDLVIGASLKEKLGVEIGDRLIITVSEVNTGEIKQELFRLSGVFGIGSKELDEGVALIHYKKLQQLLEISGVHEFVITLDDKERLLSSVTSLKNKLGSHLDIKSWKELTPQIVAVIEMSDMSISIMAGVLFVLVALGILNTMFMSLFERTYEFGVLRAVGTKSREIVSMILYEAFALSLVSVVIGVLVSLFFGFLMAYYGVDYSGIEFGEITFTEKIYFVFNLKQFTIFPLALILFTVIISLYPAWHVIRIKPAHALHRSL